MIYGMAAYGRVWTKGPYIEGGVRAYCLTQHDASQLQVVQNLVLRTVVKAGTWMDWTSLKQMSAAELVGRCGALSVHQLMASSKIALMARILRTQKPQFLAQRLEWKGRRRRYLVDVRPKGNQLRLIDDGFIKMGSAYTTCCQAT